MTNTASLKPLKVYFAAPTISSSERREIFKFIKQTLLDLGCELTYDWMEDEKKYSPKGLFARNSQGIKLADLVVAEVTFPSTGVGQQIAFAVEDKTPVIALHANWKKGANRFLAGSQGEYLKFFKYSKDTLTKILKSNLRSFRPVKLTKFNFISTLEINEELDSVGKEMGLSRSQLVRQIVDNWMQKKGLTYA